MQGFRFCFGAFRKRLQGFRFCFGAFRKRLQGFRFYFGAFRKRLQGFRFCFGTFRKRLQDFRFCFGKVLPLSNDFIIFQTSCLMTNTQYSCSQPELYILCRKGWHLCGDNLAVFTAYKPKYSATFITDNLAAINAADLMDDSKARYAYSQNLRIDLVDKKDEVLDCFQMLKGYITDAYRADKANTMIQAAGQQYYNKSTSSNWASVTALLSAMVPFVTNNLADLTADNNMPASFANQVQTLKTEFDLLYKNWSDADMAAYEETDTKITANNTIYNNLKTMLSDAQKVYRKDAAMALKFSMDDLMSQVRGTRPSGINGKITNGVNKKGIENAQVYIPELDIMVKSDANGQFQLPNLPVGKYTLMVEAAGFEKVTKLKYEIKSSVTNRLIIKMSAVPSAVVAPVLERG